MANKTKNIKEVNIVETEEPIFEYNNKTEQSYIKQNVVAPENLDLQEKNFLAEVDTTKGDIERTVTRMVRLKAPDYTTKKRERKEFLVYYENWTGKNWAGKKVAPVADHVVGVYQEQEVEPRIERNRIVGYDRTGQHTVHYIPFSKEKVDEIIENSIGSDKETIVFIVKDGPVRNDKYSYDQFVNYSFADNVKLMHKKGGPALATLEEESELDKLSKAARAISEEKKKEELVFDKEEQEPKIDKNIVHLERQEKQQEEENSKKEEKKIIKPKFELH